MTAQVNLLPFHSLITKESLSLCPNPHLEKRNKVHVISFIVYSINLSYTVGLVSATATQLCFSVSRYLLDIYLQKRTGERSTSFLDGSFGNGKQKGLIVNPLQVMATGTAERDVAAKLLSELPGKHRKTVGQIKTMTLQVL